MIAERARLYADIGRKIGNTKLVAYKEKVPNGNCIWVKRECDNPFGSHYDRVYLDLFRHHESRGDIKPGAKVLETSSGSAGVSFAGIGRMLGYECFIALPAGGEKAREKAIRKHLTDDAHLIFTPAERYISGFPQFLSSFLPNNRDIFFLNHSMGPRDPSRKYFTNNEIALTALEGIASETADELVKIDYYVPAVGNGSSVLGPARAFMRSNPQIKTIAFEPFQSAVMFDLLYPGKYTQQFGIEPGSLSRHRLPGTSYPGIDFPHIRNSVELGLVSDVLLVSDRKTDSEYREKTGRSMDTQLTHWDAPAHGCADLGRTGKAGFNVAMNIARGVSEKNILIVGYDKTDRYDSE
jgi:cysteine synthase A